MGFGSWLKKALNPLTPMYAIKGMNQRLKQGGVKSLLDPTAGFKALGGSFADIASDNKGDQAAKLAGATADLAGAQPQGGAPSFMGSSMIGSGGAGVPGVPGVGRGPDLGVEMGGGGLKALGGGGPKPLGGGPPPGMGSVGTLMRRRMGGGGPGRYGGIMGGQGSPMDDGLQKLIADYMAKKKAPGGGLPGGGGMSQFGG